MRTGCGSRARITSPCFEVELIGQRLALIEDNSGNVIELAQALGA